MFDSAVSLTLRSKNKSSFSFDYSLSAKSKPYSKILQHVSKGPDRLVKKDKKVGGKNLVTLSL